MSKWVKPFKDRLATAPREELDLFIKECRGTNRAWAKLSTRTILKRAAEGAEHPPITRLASISSTGLLAQWLVSTHPEGLLYVPMQNPMICDIAVAAYPEARRYVYLRPKETGIKMSDPKPDRPENPVILHLHLQKEGYHGYRRYSRATTYWASTYKASIAGLTLEGTKYEIEKKLKGMGIDFYRIERSAPDMHRIIAADWAEALEEDKWRWVENLKSALFKRLPPKLHDHLRYQVEFRAAGEGKIQIRSFYISRDESIKGKTIHYSTIKGKTIHYSSGSPVSGPEFRIMAAKIWSHLQKIQDQLDKRKEHFQRLNLTAKKVEAFKEAHPRVDGLCIRPLSMSMEFSVRLDPDDPRKEAVFAAIAKALQKK